VKFSELCRLVPSLDPAVAVFFLGRPGIGKSVLGRTIAALMGDDAVIVRRELTGHLPEDMSGIPFREGSFTKFCPPDFLAKLAKGSGPNGTDPSGALILEDITQASRAVQVACFQLVQERSMGDIELSPKVRIILTGNRASDKAGARELPSPLRNRVCLLSLEPDLEEWMSWAGAVEVTLPDGKTKHTGLPGVIGGFLNYKPQFFTQLPSQADKANGQFATPRSWENVGRVMLTLDPKSDPAGPLWALAGGLVGEGVAHEFVAFVKLQKELPNPKAVLDDPEKAMPSPPSEPDRLAALVTALGEYAARHQNDDKKMYLKLLLALSHVSGKTREACAAGLTVFQANGGNVSKLFDSAAQNKADPRIMAIIKHFAASVS